MITEQPTKPGRPRVLLSCGIASTRLALLVLACSGSLRAGEFQVAPDGRPDGDGSAARPWDLATALSHPVAVRPGDTILLGAGRYSGGYTSVLRGGRTAPITVRPAAGARVMLDCLPRDAKDSGVLTVDGEWTVFRDFEITCSDPKRTTTEAGSWPADIRRGGISARGSHLSFINLIIHDTGQGIGMWGNEESGEGGEIYGCLIYHNGWLGPDRGHGHGIYAQNARGTKRIEDNVIFNHFGYGLHAYGSEKASLRGFHIEGNVAFNNGCLVGKDQRSTDLAIGGGSDMDRILVSGNITHGGGGLQIGYGNKVRNRGVVIRDNRIGGHTKFTALAEAFVTGNTIVAPGTLVGFQAPPPGETPDQVTWDDNTYLRTRREWAAFNLFAEGKATGASFEEWRRLTGHDANSRYEEAPASGVTVILRPNRHEKGRAHLIVINDDGMPSVRVDLTGVLAIGQPFRIQNVQNFFGPPVHSGVWEGSIDLPLAPTPVAKPVGMSDADLPVTGPGFGVFVILPEQAP